MTDSNENKNENKSKSGALGFLLWGFDKQQAEVEATNYAKLPFYKKAKNNLAMFFIVVGVISFALIDVEKVLLGLIIYACLLPFCLLNHRWAIAAVGVLYILDKAVFIATGAGSPITHIIFGIVVANICAQAYLVATKLREQRGDTQTSEIDNKADQNEY